MINEKTISFEVDLPEGWVWKTIGDVCDKPQYGWTTSAAKEGIVKLLRTTDITSGFIDWNDVPYCDKQPENLDKYLLKDGDIVISRAGSVGYSILLIDPQNAVFASYLIRFRPNKNLNKKYFSYFLKSPAYWKEISENKLGIAVPNVNATKLKNIPIPLPSIPVQERIVSKIEELFTQLDAAEEALIHAKNNLKRYKQSLLKAAVTGELTKEWREAHKEEIEPAYKLLERIKAERKAKWEAEIRANGKDPAKEKYKEPKPPEVSDLPVLPDGWCWVNTIDLVDVGTGATPLRSKLEYYKDGTIPWITSGSLNNLYVEKADEFITDLAIRETNVKLFPKGSLLIALYGEGKTRGKVSELNIDSTTNQAIAALAFNDSANPTKEYLKIFFRYNYDNIRRLSSGGVQPNLNLSIIKNTKIPLPSIQDQREILIEVENKEMIIEEISQTIKNDLFRIKSLRNSILYQAFTGKLIQPHNEVIE